MHPSGATVNLLNEPGIYLNEDNNTLVIEDFNPLFEGVYLCRLIAHGNTEGIVTQYKENVANVTVEVESKFQIIIVK